MDLDLSLKAVSLTELRRNFAGVLRKADGEPVAVRNRRRVEAYVLPARCFEKLIEHLEDLEDAQLVRNRRAGPFIEVTLGDL